MIKTFCDRCGEQRDHFANSTYGDPRAQFVLREEHQSAFTIAIAWHAMDGSANRGHLCADCVRVIVRDGDME